MDLYEKFARVMTRRSFLGAGAVALGFPGAALSSASAERRSQVRLRLALLPPTGPHPIGTVQLVFLHEYTKFENPAEDTGPEPE